MHEAPSVFEDGGLFISGDAEEELEHGGFFGES
jgi:hypothetical protein